ncbi:4-demethylwyosine synthase TYW1 [Candidatus Woesearchaeota archaeon]|nr:4-demethylwyosine synthase TYW1 [Candidatus Woesearchaeota archaeon]
MIPELRRKQFEKEGYRVVGNHSVVKVCEYTKKALRAEDVCYKCTFYGIRSWRCVEMSPTYFCDHRCMFCWRDIKYVYPKWQGPVDEPDDIIDGCIQAWQGLLNGFKGAEKTMQPRFEETRTPSHFAISLTGEPTMYPKMPELLDALKRRNISSFLVTNGTLPEMIEKLIDHQPTQLYVSVYGPNEAVYRKTANPFTADAWERLQKTLSMLGKFNRSVIRLTLTKEWNMVDPEGYGEFLKNIDFDYLECKGYVWVGHSQDRLTLQNAPTHMEVREFAQRIAKVAGLKIIDEKENSRVCLLMKEDNANRVMTFEEPKAFKVVPTAEAVPEYLT